MSKIKIFTSIIDFRPEDLQNFIDFDQLAIFIDNKILKCKNKNNKTLEIILKKNDGKFLRINIYFDLNFVKFQYDKTIRIYDEYFFEGLIYFIYFSDFL